MQVEVQLVHADNGQRVVLASAHRDGTCLGSTLGEGSTAEEAEDRARQRLVALLEVATADSADPIQRSPRRRAAAPETSTAAPVTAPAAPSAADVPDEPPGGEPATDPEDWSSELAQLELQLKRLGWSRDQESLYLQRAFGHGSRSRLTRYGDLLAYLRSLESLGPGADPAHSPIPLRRSDLLQQCDQLLGQLQWDAGQGRRLLESHFARSSRQQLSDAQLLEFNMLLESALIDVVAISSAG